VYYKSTKAASKVDPKLAEPIKAMIEEFPSFGHRTMAHLLGPTRTQCSASSSSKVGWCEETCHRVIATAILDRVLHHAITMNIRGNSYRLKDKLKAGLVRPAETPTVK